MFGFIGEDIDRKAELTGVEEGDKLFNASRHGDNGNFESENQQPNVPVEYRNERLLWAWMRVVVVTVQYAIGFLLLTSSECGTSDNLA